MPRANKHRAPCPWQVGPSNWLAAGGYFDQLKARVQQLVKQNGGRKVVLVSFSLGGPVASVFLNRKSKPNQAAPHEANTKTRGLHSSCRELAGTSGSSSWLSIARG